MKSFAVPWSFAKRSVAMAPRRPFRCGPLQRQPRPARRSWTSAVCIRAPADDSLRPMFLESAEAALVREHFGTPCYVYDRAALEAAARAALAFPHAFGFTLRYAMKANSSRAVLRLFRDLGLHVDASSDPEVERALRAGFAPGRVQLTSQAPTRRLEEFVAQGVLYNACSLHQLDRYGRAFAGREITIRVNPGLGSGSSNRTNTGGPASSFGIWHAYLEEAKALAARHRLTIRGLHTHIGSGSDPAVWTHVAHLVLEIAGRLPEVTTVSLGGASRWRAWRESRRRTSARSGPLCARRSSPSSAG